MSRLTLVLVALAGILAGALGYAVLARPAPAPDETRIAALIENAIVAYDASRPQPAPPTTPELDQATLDPMIESFLMREPAVLQRMAEVLETNMAAEERTRSRELIAANADAIFDHPDQVVVGNPEGDVTLVEFFDYNCSYCRSALPDLATLIAEDPGLRVVLKEFPILSEASVEAARVAVLVGRSEADYWAFHEALFSSRSQVNGQVALAAAAELGLNPIELGLETQTPSVTGAIEVSYDLARQLSITGTPTYIIGNEIVPGAIGVDELRQRIANMRACGETQCPT
jgi:protein-disulfide isomerase